MIPTKLPKELKSALSFGLKSVKSAGVGNIIGRADHNRIVIWKNKITRKIHVDLYFLEFKAWYPYERFYLSNQFIV